MGMAHLRIVDTDGRDAWQMWAMMREARKVCKLMAGKL